MEAGGGGGDEVEKIEAAGSVGERFDAKRAGGFP